MDIDPVEAHAWPLGATANFDAACRVAKEVGFEVGPHLEVAWVGVNFQANAAVLGANAKFG